MTTEQSLFQNKSITLSEYLSSMLRHWYICAAAVVVCVATALFYSCVIVTPLYDSTAKLYVVNKGSETVNSSDFSISTYLTNDFSEIIVDRLVLDEVAEQLGNKYTFSQLKSFLSVEVPQSTRIIAVTARTDDPELSKQIVDTLSRVAQVSLAEKIGLDRVTVISEGTLPGGPSVPNTERNLGIALLCALCIFCGAVFLICITDNKISSSEDVEKHLGISILATIPYNRSRHQAQK